MSDNIQRLRIKRPTVGTLTEALFEMDVDRKVYLIAHSHVSLALQSNAETPYCLLTGQEGATQTKMSDLLGLLMMLNPDIPIYIGATSSEKIWPSIEVRQYSTDSSAVWLDGISDIDREVT